MAKIAYLHYGTTRTDSRHGNERQQVLDVVDSMSIDFRGDKKLAVNDIVK